MIVDVFCPLLREVLENDEAQMTIEGFGAFGAPTKEPVRVEVALVGPMGEQYKVILLDADDTFDIIIHDPLGDRECIWSLVKGS